MSSKDAEGADSADSAEERGESLESEGSGVDLLHRSLTGVMLGAFYSVHSELGHGFLESVYANAFTVLLGVAGLRVEREVPFDIVFHGQTVGCYRADLIVESKVVVEVKAGRGIDPLHAAQLLNYLRASRLEVGLLLNFGPSAQFRRIVSTHRRSSGCLPGVGARLGGDAEGAENVDHTETAMKQVALRPSRRS